MISEKVGAKDSDAPTFSMSTSRPALGNAAATLRHRDGRPLETIRQTLQSPVLRFTDLEIGCSIAWVK